MIVIPMAGLSSRFTNAGYDRPKYMLPLHGKSVFWHSVMSFAAYFHTEYFLFIVRDINDTVSFVKEEINSLGIKKYRVVVLNEETKGQAETVQKGIILSACPLDASLTIFNIDSFRKNFSFPFEAWFEKTAGYLEVFKGKGDNWSYIEPIEQSSEPVVKRTAEKEPISDLCSNGLYYFSSVKSFLFCFERENKSPLYKELYIAPLYNHLIHAGKTVHYNLVQPNDTVFCGVPAEYQILLENRNFLCN